MAAGVLAIERNAHNDMLKQKLTPRELCRCALFAALTAVMAQISIPMPMGVPMTMQTFAVILAGVVLGSRGGLIAMLVYVLMGAAGMPVFTRLGAGIGIIFGPTGGFILSFPLMAWLAGLSVEKTRIPGSLALGIALGTISNLLCGALIYKLVTGVDWPAAVGACIYPFIPGAIIKGFIAGIAGLKLRQNHLKYCSGS